MNSSKSKKILVYVIMGLLSLVGVYAEFAVCTRYYSFSMIAELVVTCVMFGLILYYSVSNFRVPHGNLLKYLFLAFAATCFVGMLNPDTTGVVSQSVYYIIRVCRGAVVIISTYIAGRLDRIRENKVLVIVNAVLLLAISIAWIVAYKTLNLIFDLFLLNFFILWLDLMIAYLFRYRSHKEAGLADK